MKTVTENEVRKIIKSLKNKSSSGFDGITPINLKKCAEIVLIPLTYIINTSIVTGIFPNELKSAKITPLYKGKGKKDSIQNYRPISVVNTISKVLETCIEKQIRNFCEQNNLLPAHQHGFRKGRSTNSALLDLTNFIYKNKNKGLITGTVLLDLSSAYDVVDHELLLQKLEILGFDNLTCDWFKSYLTERSQTVVISGHESKKTLS